MAKLTMKEREYLRIADEMLAKDRKAQAGGGASSLTPAARTALETHVQVYPRQGSVEARQLAGNSLAYAQQSPKSAQEIALGLAAGNATRPSKGNISALDMNQLRQGTLDNETAMKILRDLGALNTTENVRNRETISMVGSDYLKEQATTSKALMAANSAMDSIHMTGKRMAYPGTAAKKEKAAQWRDFYDLYGYEKEMPLEVMLRAEAIANGTGRTVRDFDLMDDETYDREYAALEEWYKGLDHFALTEDPKEITYESETGKWAEMADMQSAEIARRETLERLTAMAMGNADYETLSQYTAPAYAPVQPKYNDANSRAYAQQQNEFVGQLVDQQYYINNPGTYSQRMRAADVSPVVQGYMKAGYEYLTPDEIGVYNALYSTDQAAAAEYLEALSPDLLRRRAQVQYNYNTVIGEDPFAGAAASLATILRSPAAALNTLYGGITGENDPNASVYDLQRGNTAIRTAQAQLWGDMASFDVLGQPVGTTIYNTLMSLGDMGMAYLMGGALAGGNAAFAQQAMGFIMSSEAAAGTIHEDLQRGFTAEQALLHGITNGTVEYLSERIPLGELFSNEGKLAWRIIKTSFSEGGEEIFSGTVKIGTDALFSYMSGRESEVEKVYKEYAKTMSHEDAVRATLSHYAEEVALQGVTGFFSGGAMGTAAHTANDMQVRSYGKSVMAEGDVDAMLNIAGGMRSDSQSAEWARRLTEKKNKGKKISTYDVGRLTMAMESDLSAELAEAPNMVMDKAIEERLVELGEDSANAAKLAPVIRKMYRGQKINPAARMSVRWDNNAEQVVKELSRDVAEEDMGRAGTEWASAAKTDAAMATFEGTTRLYELGKAKGTIKETAPQEGAKADAPETVEAAASAAVEKSAAKVKVSKGTKVPSGKVRAVLFDADGSTVEGTSARFTEEGGKLKMTVDTADGTKTIPVESVQSTEDAGLAAVAQYVEDSNNNADGTHQMSAEEANAMMHVYEVEGGDAAKFISNFEKAYLDGYAGVEMALNDLSENAAKLAYDLGKKEAEANEAKRVQRTQEAKAASRGTVAWLGTVTTNEQASGRGGEEALAEAMEGMSESQRSTVEVVQAFAQEFKTNVVLFESDAENIGRIRNGSFDAATNTIYIDVNSGAYSAQDIQQQREQGTLGYAIMRTMGHELTHYLEYNSAEGYAKYKQAVKTALSNAGQDWASLVRSKIDVARRDGRKLTYAAAEAEVVADASEYMLQDSKFVAQIDNSVKGKIKRFIQNFMQKLQNAFRHLTEGHRESIALRELVDGVYHYTGDLQQLWDAAMEETMGRAESAYEPTEATEYDTEAPDGIVVDEDSGSAYPTMLSTRTWSESDYVANRDEAAKRLAKQIGVSVKKAKKWIDDVNSISAYILDNKARLDYIPTAVEGMSAFKSNPEYGGSIDMSTICAKRRLATGTLDAIQRVLGDEVLTKDDFLRIREMMKERKYEVACGLCFVESSRKNLSKYNKQFLDQYKAEHPDSDLGMVDLNTVEGLERIRSNPETADVYAAYEKFMNKLAQRKPKLFEKRTEYNHEILKKFKSDTTVGIKNRNGGLRLQSFSDFEIVHLIDMMQVITDMASVGLAGQAYTKVPDFAWALGDTGLKINLSLIAKDVDADGNLIFDDVEGMNHEEAKRLRDSYSKNVGTIVVTFTDEQTIAAMKSDFIDYIIPFHRSQWQKGDYKKLGLPEGTKDYTLHQNEKEGRKRVKENFLPNAYWDFSVSGKQNAINYLNMCAEAGRTPKFAKFLDKQADGSYRLKEDGSTDGYWKLLIDFKMYDNAGVGSPQLAVQPTFNMDEAARMLEEYKGEHDTFPVAQDVVDDFVKEYRGNVGGVKKSDGRYSVDSVRYSTRDQTDTESFKRWFGNSQVVDEEGSPLVVYHGTEAEFETFDMTKGRANMDIQGAFFSPYIEDAQGYGGTVKAVYLKIENPADESTAYRALNKFKGQNGAGVKARELLIKMGYDGVYNGYDEYIAFYPNQIKSATDNVGTFDPNNPDIRYSTRDLAGTIDIRDYLGNMKERPSMTETEKILLKRYQRTLGQLAEAEKKVAEQETLLRTATGDEITKTKNRIKIYRGQADRISRELLAMESDTGFARLMATSQEVLNRYLLGSAGNVADAADALDEEVKGLTKQLKAVEADVTRTSQAQRTAFARGLFDQQTLNRAAQKLKDAYGSRMSVKAIADRLALVYGEIYADNGAEGAKRFAEAAKELAYDILQGHKYRYKSETLPMLAEKIGTISLTETDMQEIKNAGMTISEYKKALAPWVKIAEGASDLSSVASNAMYYGDGALAAILGDDTEGNLAMNLYNYIQQEKAREREIGVEGMSEGEMITAVMADIAGSDLPLSTNSKTAEYLRNEMKKFAGDSAVAAQNIEQMINNAQKATTKASEVWRAAVKEVETAKKAVEYYRALDEHRRVMELREQKQIITEELKSDAAKKLQEKVKAQREEYRAREQKAREYRHAREDVEKLRRKVGRDIKRLNTMRVRETDKKHVPQEFQALADAIMRTFTDSELSRLAFSAEKTASLQRTYRILGEMESDFTYYWDDEVQTDIDNLVSLSEGYSAMKKRGPGVPSYLSLEGVELEVEILQGVDNIVSNALNMIDMANRKFLTSRQETFEAYANRTGENLVGREDHKVRKGALGKWQTILDESIRTGNMTPVYFFEHLQNQEIKAVFDEVRQGMREYAKIIEEGVGYVQEMQAKHNYGKWVSDGKLKMKTGQGHTIELTREEAAELYALYKREQANKLYQTEHLLKGGFQYRNIAEKVSEDGKTRAKDNPHQLDAADMARISEWLTEEQKAYADALVGFLSTTMADYGNAASMSMYGYKKFTESYYIPFRTVAAQRMQKGDEGAKGADAGTGRLRNAGFTNKVQTKANATLYIGGITETVADHIHKMAAYSAMVQPIEDLKRLLNHKVVEGDGTINTIRALIGQKYGQAAEDYISQLLKDLNGATQSDNRASAFTDKMISAFKRGAVMASASVVLQQPMAMARAMAMVSPKYFLNNPFYRPSKGLWQKMMKYSGATVIKDMGKFDIGMGLSATQYIMDEKLGVFETYRRLKADSKTKAGKAAFDRLIDRLTAAPGMADQWTWGLIWQAVENEQADMYPTMDHSSDEFLNIVGKRFDDVVDHTQVYDSVLTKSNLMRSSNQLHKMATSFMSEPVLSLNMLYDAVMGKHGKKMGARIIGSVVASQVLAGAMAALVQAWNDDEDKRNWLEKYADRATGNILSNINIFGMIPYISDIVSLFEGYDVERPDMSAIADLVDYTKTFMKSFENGGPTWKQVENFAGTWANLLGIPAKNISREVRRTRNMIWNTDWSAPNMSNVGYVMMENLPGYSDKNTVYYDRIVAAELRGDEEEAKDLRTYMLTSKMVTEDKMTSGLKTAMKDRYIEGDMDDDTAIAYLQKVGAEETEDDAYWEVDKWKYARETGDSTANYRKYDDFFEAVESGTNLKATVQVYLDNGVSKTTMASQITSKYKPLLVELWKAGKKGEFANLQARILTAYEALGYDRAKKLKDIEAWLK